MAIQEAIPLDDVLFESFEQIEVPGRPEGKGSRSDTSGCAGHENAFHCTPADVDVKPVKLNFAS